MIKCVLQALVLSSLHLPKFPKPRLLHPVIAYLISEHISLLSGSLHAPEVSEPQTGIDLARPGMMHTSGEDRATEFR